MVTVLYDSLRGRYPDLARPEWYPEAVRYLRGNADEGLFGLYLYLLIRERQDVSTVINIGTARGHSAVCAAKALKDSGRNGVVHTVDRIDPHEPYQWHVEKHPPSDPLARTDMTMEELIGRFHDPLDDSVPIRFHTGDTSEVLADWEEDPPDLVFHDAGHQYKRVKTDIRLTSEMGEHAPLSIFDDCYLYHPISEYRPFIYPSWYEVDPIPKLGGVTRRLRQYSISKTRFHGVQRAVGEAFASGQWAKLELIADDDHAPMATLFPRNEAEASD